MLVREILEHQSDDDDNWNWRCLRVSCQLIILRQPLSCDPTFPSRYINTLVWLLVNSSQFRLCFQTKAAIHPERRSNPTAESLSGQRTGNTWRMLPLCVLHSRKRLTLMHPATFHYTTATATNSFPPSLPSSCFLGVASSWQVAPDETLVGLT